MPAAPSDLSGVLTQWFEAHRGGDLEAARALLAPDADISVPGGRLSGFDGLMAWYAERSAALGPGFRYELVDVLAGAQHAAAVLRLTDGERTWQQVAVYRIEEGRIAAITAFED